MVPVVSLWLPVLVSAVLVFMASSVMHMVLTYHRGDYRKLPAEDQVMEALRKFDIKPGDYMMPCAGSMAETKTPGFMEKMKQGPVAMMTVMPSGQMTLGKSLIQWFLYCIVVGIFAGYLAGIMLGPGAEYRRVFRIVSCAAFMGYALALAQTSIWYKRNWATTLKAMFDGLIYGLLTGGVFGWLWPS